MLGKSRVVCDSGPLFMLRYFRPWKGRESQGWRNELEPFVQGAEAALKAAESVCRRQPWSQPEKQRGLFLTSISSLISWGFEARLGQSWL